MLILIATYLLYSILKNLRISVGGKTQSPISSRKSDPPWAISTSLFCILRISEAPLSLSKEFAFNSWSGKEAQLKTNGLSFLADAWISAKSFSVLFASIEYWIDMAALFARLKLFLIDTVSIMFQTLLTNSFVRSF